MQTILNHWAGQAAMLFLFVLLILSLIAAVRAHKEEKGRATAWFSAIGGFLGILMVVVLYFYFQSLFSGGSDTVMNSPEGKGILELIRSMLLPAPTAP